MEKLKIEYVDINSIKPYKKNAKLHPEEQIEQIKKSIEEFGMDDPIGIWKDEIVEGHGRLMACKELGYTEIPIIRLDHLTDEQRKAYALAHNKLTMNSDFDLDLLNEELLSIGDIDMTNFGFDIDLGIEEDKPLKADLHPTMKPLKLCANFIKNSTKPKEIVMDLFGGSGSTLIACEQLDRICYTMEYDPKYVDVIIERWENFTGKKAVKISE